MRLARHVVLPEEIAEFVSLTRIIQLGYVGARLFCFDLRWLRHLAVASAFSRVQRVLGRLVLLLEDEARGAVFEYMRFTRLALNFRQYYIDLDHHANYVHLPLRALAVCSVLENCVCAGGRGVLYRVDDRPGPAGGDTLTQRRDQVVATTFAPDAAAFVSALSLTPFRAILGDMHHSVPIVRRVGRAQLSCPVLGSTCGGPFVLAAACVSSR